MQPSICAHFGWLVGDGVSAPISPQSSLGPITSRIQSGDELANFQWSGTKPRLLPSLCGAKEMLSLIKT